MQFLPLIQLGHTGPTRNEATNLAEEKTAGNGSRADKLPLSKVLLPVPAKLV
jgi:hypothetical protein